MIALLLACAPKAPVVVAPSAPPAPVDILGPAPSIPAPAPWGPPSPAVATLMNGGDLWVLPAASIPLVTVSIGVDGGALCDAGTSPGTAWLSDRLLSQGAGAYDAAGFATALDRLGAQLDVSTGPTSSRITLSARTGAIDAALELVATMIRSPRFATADFERERDLAVENLTLALDDPPTVASRVGYRAWYPEGHPYAAPPDGTVAGLRGTKLTAVKACWKSAWGGGPDRVAVAGDLTLERAKAVLDARFGDMKRVRASATTGDVPAHSAERIRIVDMPGSAQTMFFVAFPGVAAGAPEVQPTRAGTIVLGGTFTSRLNALLREEKGYTYGARASTEVGVLPGAQVIRTRIRTDVTGPAMADIVAELAKIRAGITPAELKKAQGAFRSDLVEALETREGAAMTLAGYQDLGLPPGTMAAELATMNAVTPEAVAAQMARFDVSKAVVVLVGDRAVIEPALKAAGFGPFEVVKAE